MYLMFINLPQPNSTDMLFFFEKKVGPKLDELYLDGAYLDGPNYGRFLPKPSVLLLGPIRYISALNIGDN